MSNSQEISLNLVTEGAVELEIVHMQEVRGSNPSTSVSFCKKSCECGENKNFTAKIPNLIKIHR